LWDEVGFIVFFIDYHNLSLTGLLEKLMGFIGLMDLMDFGLYRLHHSFPPEYLFSF